MLPSVIYLINAAFLCAQTSSREDAVLRQALSSQIHLEPSQKISGNINNPWRYRKPRARRFHNPNAEKRRNFYWDHLPALWPQGSTFRSSTASPRSEHMRKDVQPAWVSHYASENAPGEDAAFDLAVDHAGNVYITGYSLNTPYMTDCFAARYDPSGNLMWTAYYNGPGNGNDYGYAIDLDSQGNVYVAGHSRGIGESNDDYVTIKYNSDGVEQWVVRYDGPGNTPDRATALMVDDLDNIYVTGGSPDSGTSTGFATIKYNSAGVEQWVVQYHDPNTFAGVRDMTIDDSGNVYLAGHIDQGQGVNANYLTIKYDSSGVEQWRATLAESRLRHG